MEEKRNEEDLFVPERVLENAQSLVVFRGEYKYSIHSAENKTYIMAQRTGLKDLVLFAFELPASKNRDQIDDLIEKLEDCLKEGGAKEIENLVLQNGGKIDAISGVSIKTVQSLKRIDLEKILH